MIMGFPVETPSVGDIVTVEGKLYKAVKGASHCKGCAGYILGGVSADLCAKLPDCMYMHEGKVVYIHFQKLQP